MQSFFKQLTPRNNAFKKQNVLLLLNSTPHLLNRSYSTSAKTVENHEQDVRKNQVREEALKKYGLADLKLVWPDSIPSIEKKVIDYKSKNPASIKQMYGEADLSTLPIFKGGFINFGYWPNFVDKEMTEEERIESSRQLYKVVSDLAQISSSHNVLEVGSGLGFGSEFISHNYAPKIVVGLDISPDQIARAKKYQIVGIKEGRLRFSLGEAESMPFTAESFDRIISVEAAQHFYPIEAFSREIPRLLKPDGKFVMTSFFPKSQEGVEALNAIVPSYHVHGSANTIEEVREEIAKHMETVKVTSIGKNVWQGFSKWLDQIGFHNQWSKIWPELYKRGLIDYVTYEAQTPKKMKYIYRR